MSLSITIIFDRMDQLEKEVKELRKEMRECRFYRQENLEPEKEAPPFESWVK